MTLSRHLAGLILVLTLGSTLVAQTLSATGPASRPTTRRARVQYVPKHYYVAPTGNDAAAGTQDQPFATIQKAADSINPGDTVHIAGGIYRERVLLTRSGSYLGRTSSFIADPGAKVIIDAQGLPGRARAIFDTGNQDHLYISGITVQNSDSCGIDVYGSWQVTLENCRSFNTAASGIIIDKSGMVKVLSCEVEKACARGGEESISVKRSQDVLVQNSYIHHTGHEGIDVKEGSKHVRIIGNRLHNVERQALYAEAWDSPTFDIRFEDNIVYDSGFGIAAGSECGGELRDVWFVNNLVYNNAGPGLITADWGGRYPHPVKDIYFIRNTVVNNGHGPRNWHGGMVFENAAIENIVVEENILANNGESELRIVANKKPVSWTVRRNLVWGKGEVFGESNIQADPQFASVEQRDFTLLPNSPALAEKIGYRTPAPTTQPSGN